MTSCFGLGWLPIAPGTWGSLPPTVIFALMCYLGASTALLSIVMLILAALGSIICVILAPASIAATGKEDPGEVVADELAGQAITFLILGVLIENQITLAAIGGFLFFRFFDIIKPWPIRRLEKLPAGWGILCDDLLAGVYAGIASLVCMKIWFAVFGG